MVDQSFYKRYLDPAKVVAETQVRQALSNIGNQLFGALDTLESVDQKPTLNIAAIEASLNSARDDWLSSMKAVFDDAILSIKNKFKGIPTGT